MMLSPLAIGAVTEVDEPERGATSTARATATSSRRSSRSMRRASRSTRSPSSTSSTAPRTLDGGRRRRARARARGARAGGVERAALRAHRQRDVDAARADPRRQRHRAARVRPARARRSSSSTAPSRSCSTSRSSASRPSSRTSTSCSRTRSRRSPSSTRRAATSPAPRPASATSTGSPSGFQPGNLIIIAARPSMGKSALALVHGRERRGAARDAGRAVHARDVEVGGDAAPDVLRGQGRVAAAAHRQARRRRLAAPHGGVRQAREGADLRRRHGLDHDDGDPLEAAAAEDARSRISGS